MPHTGRAEAAIERVEASAFTVPTDAPESDGTLRWESTTLVLVEASAGGTTGIGWSYTHAAAVDLIRETLAGVVQGTDALAPGAAWRAMRHRIRNVGRPGLVASAIAAVDIALWDLKARLHDLPLAVLLGRVRDGVPVYGSGGFTSYSLERLREQLSGWAAEGIASVKMKVNRHPGADVERVQAAREAVGDDVALFVDGNGALGRKQALLWAEIFADLDVARYEEPVSSDDLEGLRLIRDRGPAGMDVSAGEYGYDLFYFRRMLEAGAVDVLQADITRCQGLTGFLRAATLCDAFSVPLSAHTAPALHLHPCCATETVRDIEYFHDHVRIERMLFEGAAEPEDGALHPDLSRPGMGLELRRADAEKYKVR